MTSPQPKSLQDLTMVAPGTIIIQFQIPQYFPFWIIVGLQQSDPAIVLVRASRQRGKLAFNRAAVTDTDIDFIPIFLFGSLCHNYPKSSFESLVCADTGPLVPLGLELRIFLVIKKLILLVV